MEAPIAALAVARMIASATTSTRSEREIASLVVLDIGLYSFGSLISLGLSAWSISLLLVLAPLRRFNSRVLFQSGCFDFAYSPKVPNGSQHLVIGFCPSKNESSNKKISLT